MRKTLKLERSSLALSQRMRTVMKSLMKLPSKKRKISNNPMRRRSRMRITKLLSPRVKTITFPLKMIIMLSISYRPFMTKMAKLSVLHKMKGPLQIIWSQLLMLRLLQLPLIKKSLKFLHLHLEQLARLTQVLINQRHTSCITLMGQLTCLLMFLTTTLTLWSLSLSNLVLTLRSKSTMNRQLWLTLAALKTMLTLSTQATKKL